MTTNDDMVPSESAATNGSAGVVQFPKPGATALFNRFAVERLRERDEVVLRVLILARCPNPDHLSTHRDQDISGNYWRPLKPYEAEPMLEQLHMVLSTEGHICAKLLGRYFFDGPCPSCEARDPAASRQ